MLSRFRLLIRSRDLGCGRKGEVRDLNWSPRGLLIYCLLRFFRGRADDISDQLKGVRRLVDTSCLFDDGNHDYHHIYLKRLIQPL